MDTWTAERTFARNQLDFHQQKTSFLLMKMKAVFICAAIHSAVRVFTGEADEIAAQSYCGFCVRISKKRHEKLVTLGRMPVLLVPFTIRAVRVIRMLKPTGLDLSQ
jgi:hypothetical protein